MRLALSLLWYALAAAVGVEAEFLGELDVPSSPSPLYEHDPSYYIRRPIPYW